MRGLLLNESERTTTCSFKLSGSAGISSACMLNVLSWKYDLRKTGSSSTIYWLTKAKFGDSKSTRANTWIYFQVESRHVNIRAQCSKTVLLEKDGNIKWSVIDPTYKNKMNYPVTAVDNYEIRKTRKLDLKRVRDIIATTSHTHYKRLRPRWSHPIRDYSVLITPAMVSWSFITQKIKITRSTPPIHALPRCKV